MVDPAAYTPPYDHALCSALGRAGAEVTLVTSRFAYGEVARPEGYVRRELFYRASSRLGSRPRPTGGSRLARGLRTGARLAEHVPGMLLYRRLAREAEVVHFQWLAVQQIDAFLLPRQRPAAAGSRTVGARGRPALVLTAHDILPREPRPGQLAAQRRLYGRFDAIVVHSERGRRRLVDELGVDGARVHVIAHGALRTSAPGAASPSTSRSASGLPPSAIAPPSAMGLPSEMDPPSATTLPSEMGLPFQKTDRPVALLCGLLRPYKGLEDLIEAWRGIEGAELWIVGMPRYDICGLRRSAPASVRFWTRFVSDAQLAACLERADLVVLPYREADQSGVALTALGAGVPLLLSDVGGFPELAGTGAAKTFKAGDVRALQAALRELLGDRGALAEMAERARAAAAGPYSWDAIARRTLELYGTLLGR